MRRALAAWLSLCLAAVAQEPASTQPASSQPAASQPAASLDAAQRLWLGGDYEAAADQFRAQSAGVDTAVGAAVGLARCGLMTGSYTDALADLDTVADRAAGDADWHVARVEVLSRLGRYDEAIEHARKALGLDGQDYRSRNLLGQLLELTGQRDEAVDTYAFFDRMLKRRMPTTAEGITQSADGFYRFSVLSRHPNLSQRTVHVLREMLQVAYQRVDRTYWPARIASADLLRSKYNLREAAEDYEAALRINESLPEAHVGLGHIALDGWDFEEVDRRVEAALAINPHHAGAHNLRAQCKIVERRYDEAIENAGKVLEVNPHDVAALALTAAAYRAKYDFANVERYERQVADVNPKCAPLYSIMGDVLSALRQYADSEAAYLKSIEFEPTDPNPRTELGLMYMQWGREDKARQALDAAWELDDFNERTFNTLDLLEKLEAFATLETNHFTVRYDANQDWPVARRLAAAAEEIYEDVCDLYGTELSEKTILEVFPTHRDFGVRITGKPWIHTVGACTGWVIALDSPRPSPQTNGPYNMAHVLRHEFTHTVTLALTENRIAHWFTEGLAVHGEDSPRGFAWRELLADAIRRDRLFTLESIDWGFVRPQRPNDRQMAYAQSEWMVEYVVHHFGYDALNTMLAAFKEAKPQAQVLQETLGIDVADFDEAFAAWARSEAADWGFDLTPPEDADALRKTLETTPEDATLLGRLARAEFDAGRLDKATEAARQALEVDENEPAALHVLAESVTMVAAQAPSQEQRDQMFAQAVPYLERLAVADPTGWLAPKLLGEWALRNNEYDKAVTWLERFKELCPDHPASYQGLAGVYLQRGQLDLAKPLLLELVRMDENDAEVPSNLASIFAADDRLGEARYWYNESLYINPFDPMTHRKLADVLLRMNDTAAAVDEYETLCKLEPQRADNHASAAFAYQKLNRPDKAAYFAKQAVELDPNSPAKSLLGNEPALSD